MKRKSKKELFILHARSLFYFANLRSYLLNEVQGSIFLHVSAESQGEHGVLLLLR